MEENEASASSPFAPKSSLVRTPPSGLAPPHGGSTGPGPEDGTPSVPPRKKTPPKPPRSTPPRTSAPQPTVSVQPAPWLETPTPMEVQASSSGKRQLTSPEERRDNIRMCRPTPQKMQQPRSAPTTRPSTPVIPEDEVGVNADGTLAQATKLELLDRANGALREIIGVATNQSSRLNKESMNTISSRVQDATAIFAALSLRLCEVEAKLAKADLRCAELETALLREKTSAPAVNVAREYPPSSSTVNYARALKLAKNTEPIKIPAVQGPVLAVYPAPEQVANFKSAEQTKAELKRAIRPETMNVQIERVRKVGNAGVIVQTTSQASAEKIKEAMPATLRVSEPKQRSPLMALRHVEGEGDLEPLYNAQQEQNFGHSGEDQKPEQTSI